MDFNDFENAEDPSKRMLGSELLMQMQVFIGAAVAPMDLSVFWNDELASLLVEKIHETESAVISRLGNNAASYIYSKGVPVASFYTLNHPESLVSSYSFLEIQTGWKLDLLAGSYVPTQGRTKLQLTEKAEKDVMDCIYIAISETMPPDSRIANMTITYSESSGDYNQFLPLGMGRILNYYFRGASISSLDTGAIEPILES